MLHLPTPAEAEAAALKRQEQSLADASRPLGKNNLRRPYDDYLSVPALARARQLRLQPDGEVLPIRRKRINGELVPVYPWKKVQLGDMFFAPVEGRSVSAMRIGFSKAAARHDFEICVLAMKDPMGVPSLRVSITAIGVNEAKRKAFADGAVQFAPPTVEQEDTRIRDKKARKAAKERDRYRRKREGFIEQCASGRAGEGRVPNPFRTTHVQQPIVAAPDANQGLPIEEKKAAWEDAVERDAVAIPQGVSPEERRRLLVQGALALAEENAKKGKKK